MVLPNVVTPDVFSQYVPSGATFEANVPLPTETGALGSGPKLGAAEEKLGDIVLGSVTRDDPEKFDALTTGCGTVRPEFRIV